MNTVQVMYKHHSIDIDLLVDLRHNFGAGGACHNLSLWFESNEKMRFTSDYRYTIHNISTSKHHPEGTGIVVRGPPKQHAKHTCSRQIHLTNSEYWWCRLDAMANSKACIRSSRNLQDTASKRIPSQT